MKSKAKCQGVCICPECEKVTRHPSLKTRLTRVNEALHKLGLTYHDYKPVYAIDSALVDNGFEPTSWDGVSERYHGEVGDGKFISLSVYRMDSGRYEVVAYVN